MNCAAQSTIQGHVTARVNKYPKINEDLICTQCPHNGILDCTQFLFGFTPQKSVRINAVSMDYGFGR